MNVANQSMADRLRAQGPLLIAGNRGGTHIGESLLRAAETQALKAQLLESSSAYEAPRFVRAFFWRWRDRTGLHFRRYQNQLLASAEALGATTLIATGSGPITAATLQTLRARGVRCLNFSTDDPWNPVHRSRWALEALPHYDCVYTPRQANLAEFQAIGATVRYLPFGYDPKHCQIDAALAKQTPAYELLFVGGADADRKQFMRELLRGGARPSIVGDYWQKSPEFAEFALGMRPPEVLAALTANAAICLILVRRANRDGHVMRSLEAAGTGACLLVEDTPEHRALFGADGEQVRYFTTATEAAQRAQELLADRTQREALRSRLKLSMQQSAHTYRDRLETMLLNTSPAS